MLTLKPINVCACRLSIYLTVTVTPTNLFVLSSKQTVAAEEQIQYLTFSGLYLCTWLPHALLFGELMSAGVLLFLALPVIVNLT